MLKVEVIKCVCKHDYQDGKYGKNMRVMNPVGKGDNGSKDGTHKCTVCGKYYTVKR